MFTERTYNTLKQFRRVTLQQKWPEVREAEQPNAIQVRTHSEKRRNPQKW
jgi:hypothetical protein